jgi:hypothetical protein
VLCKYFIFWIFLFLIWIFRWIFNLIQTWSFLWTFLGQLSFSNGCLLSISFQAFTRPFLLQELKWQLHATLPSELSCHYMSYPKVMLRLLVLPSFWFLLNILETFNQLQWVRSCIGWWVKLYVCSFMTFFLLIISSNWCGNHGWVCNNGLWCLSYSKHPSWLGGVIVGCHKCFQHHFSNNHF